MQWRRHLVHVIVVQYSVGGEYIGGLLWVMIDYYHIITITLPRNAFRDGINIQQTGVCTSPLMQVNITVPIFWYRYFDWTLNLQRRHFNAWRDYIWRQKMDWKRLPCHFFWIYFSISSCSCSVSWFLIGWQCWNIKCRVKFWFKQLDWFGKCCAHMP